MKKIMMMAVCLTASAFIFAQDVHFGLKAGVNVAGMNVDNEPDFNSRASFYLGGLAHIHISPHFALQPELFYSGQGGKDGGEIVRLGYINLPVLAQYMAGNGFRLQTGPQLGFLVSAKDEFEGVTDDIKDNLKAIDVAWTFGASYQFPGSGLGIDARYNIGLSNIRDDGGNNTYNRVFGLGLFYQFMNHARRR